MMNHKGFEGSIISASKEGQPGVIAVLLIVCPVCLLLKNKQTDLAKSVGDLVFCHFRAVCIFQPHCCGPFVSQQNVCYLFAKVGMQLKLFVFLVRCIKSLKCFVNFF